MSALAEKVLHCLDGVRPMGAGRWMALCPAHADKTPSLSVRDADGKVLLYCFAGCPSADVLSSIGLTWQDLYADPREAAYRAATSRRGRKFHNLGGSAPVGGIDLDHERLVIEIAKADAAAGKPISTEDRARVALAHDRLKAAKRGAA